jgi:hypothetical protein
MGQSERMEISQVRAVVAGLMRGEPISFESVETAREAVQSMFVLAAAHGLTVAEVVRAVLVPVFDGRRGCDCPTCKTRRGSESLWHSFVPVA